MEELELRDLDKIDLDSNDIITYEFAIRDQIKKGKKIKAYYAKFLELKGEIEKAEEMYEEAIKTERHEALCDYAIFLKKIKKYEEAIEIFKKLKPEECNEEYSNTEIARCYNVLGDFDNALKYIEKAQKIEENPDETIMIAEFEMYYLQEQFEKAEIIKNKILESTYLKATQKANAIARYLMHRYYKKVYKSFYQDFENDSLTIEELEINKQNRKYDFIQLCEKYLEIKEFNYYVSGEYDNIKKFQEEFELNFELQIEQNLQNLVENPERIKNELVNKLPDYNDIHSFSKYFNAKEEGVIKEKNKKRNKRRKNPLTKGTIIVILMLSMPRIIRSLNNAFTTEYKQPENYEEVREIMREIELEKREEEKIRNKKILDRAFISNVEEIDFPNKESYTDEENEYLGTRIFNYMLKVKDPEEKRILKEEIRIKRDEIEARFNPLP